jgi:cell division protein FtsW
MLRPGQVIALCVLALLTIGVVMVNSAGMKVGPVEGPEQHLPELTAATIIFSRSTCYMLLAIAAMGCGALVPVRRLAGIAQTSPEKALKAVAVGCVGLILICGLVYVPGLSRHMNGSHRWIELPVPGLGDALSIQPSEIAKWGMIGLMAWYITARARMLSEFWRGLVPALVAIGGVAGFIVLEDLGTGVLIAMVACLLLLAGGARVRYFAAAVPIGVVGLVGAILMSPYRVKRVLAFMDPYADPQGIGYHTIQSLAAIANGGGFGRGLGHGLQKFGYLPENRTDFLFAIICEELGIAGAGLVIALFGTLTWAGFSIMRREREPVLKLLCMGIIATVGLQATINLAVVTGLAPTKGIALPLLSSGGTGWILTAFSLGLLVAVDRSQADEASGSDSSGGETKTLVSLEVKPRVAEPVAA